MQTNFANSPIIFCDKNNRTKLVPSLNEKIKILSCKVKKQAKLKV